MSEWRADLTVAAAIIRRNFNEILRVPGGAIPGIIAPTIFLIGLTSVFGDLQRLPGFTADQFISFLVPVTLLQAASFSGAATGVNLARDIELGWFDRILVSRAPRPVILGGLLAAATMRALLPITVALIVAFALGAAFPGVGGLAVAVGVACLFAGIAAAWASILAMRFKTQAAAPLMQSTVFMAVLFTTSYAPEPLLSGWFRHVAHYNPVTQILEAVRQGFVGGVTWGDTWPGLVVVAAGGTLLVALALRSLVRMGR
ncbi:MAG: type transport system permease protein [Thermoleophilaceae bacterium]|nr:type transport system permease protein [Thermoleophilaceae bacterium]